MMGRTTLATRITALCLVVAAAALIVAGVIIGRLTTSAVRESAREALSRQADVVASQVEPRDFGRPSLRIPKVVKVLRGQGIVLVLRRADGSHTGTARAQEAARNAGLEGLPPSGTASEVEVVDGQETLVEARGIGPRVGFALVVPARLANGTEQSVAANLLLATGIGLAVATGGGLLVAWLLARPLRRTATVAASMQEGRRDLRAPVAGPVEVAQVAESVNGLADSLAHSEARQREFLLSVSHELRTPLTTVNGFAESLADGVVSGAEVPEVGRTMYAESQRLSRLVDDLLDLARLGADEFRLDRAEIDLASWLPECARAWGPRCAAAGIELSVEAPDRPVVVHADPRRLRQVVDVFVDNALRVCPPGTPLVLAAAYDAACDGTYDGGSGVVQVRDGGPGLSEDDYRVAFERGVLRGRYHGQRPVGSGIGLALAYGLVTRMGGTLRAGPAPEGGAGFTLALPLAT